jgi:hypothetical protein
MKIFRRKVLLRKGIAREIRPQSYALGPKNKKILDGKSSQNGKKPVSGKGVMSRDRKEGDPCSNKGFGDKLWSFYEDDMLPLLLRSPTVLC